MASPFRNLVTLRSSVAHSCEPILVVFITLFFCLCFYLLWCCVPRSCTYNAIAYPYCMSLWELTSVNIWPSPIRHGARTQCARTQHEEYYCVWGDIFFWRAKWWGDHPNVLQYKDLQLTTQYVHIDFRNPIANDVWWWTSLSHTHCEGWRCRWRHDIRTPIANDDNA